MKYVSTRGDAPSLSFEEVVLTGLAADGGLYVPESLPQFSQQQIESWSELSFQDLALEIFKPFIGDEIAHDDLKMLVDKSYQGFSHPSIAPLVKLDENEWVLELFHGPTLAFKDFALQFLGNLLDFILAKREQKVVVMGATSGDTGSAAIEGCRQCENIDIFILHPHQRVSEVQRRQMTTAISDNVFNIAVDGNFDDCQNIVKASFRDQSFLPDGRQLVAVNSINWARIMAQITYYFYASFALGGAKKELSFAVPTGNFGDIYAGYLARKMGLPIKQLIIATNANDILHRCISNNDHSRQALYHSVSPSMDIMVSSNFERLLFDLSGRDGGKITQLMTDLEAGAMHLDDDMLHSARELFSSFRLSDEATLDTIAQVHRETNYLLDPHTAIGVAAGRSERQDTDTAMVFLATAHPAKFPAEMKRALPEMEAPLPAHMQDIYAREERYTVMQNDKAAVQAFVAKQLRIKST